MSPLLVVSLLAALFLVSIGWLLRSLILQNREPLPDAAWLQNFSAARYRPMLRLLAEDDYEFLKSAGSDRSVVRRLRVERRRIFRMYLNNLVRDFSRLHRAARILVVEAEQEQPEVAERLVRLRFQFFFAVLGVRCRLALHTLGIGTVDVRNLIGSLEALRGDFGTLVPVRPPVGA